MKILIQTNERSNKRFLLTVGQSVTKDEIRKIIDVNDEKALRRLIARSAEMTEVSSRETSHAHVDFVVNPNGYTLERLA